ncbi:hypothetical protein AVEN_166952-1 [Araneus ventricosus]|uniref:Mos1 transposase HTH domain-containing protein n=1 Tax=Araneus ventricosus TaxID=182803 RepID=A0A4Y2SZF8_ARAVE|nr:hypothetical protein AVEN_166952-1 [Araneus ventricosus]
MLKKAYGNDGMKKTAVYKWHKRFRQGQKPRESDGEFIPEGQTVHKDLCLEILKRLQDAIRRKRPENWATNDWFLLPDNAPTHRALIVKKYLARHSVTTLEHPPYSPDLAPADFYPFPRLKMKLKGHRFVDSDEVIENATKQLKDLSKMDSRSVFLTVIRTLKEVCGCRRNILRRAIRYRRDKYSFKDTTSDQNPLLLYQEENEKVSDIDHEAVEVDEPELIEIFESSKIFFSLHGNLCPQDFTNNPFLVTNSFELKNANPFKRPINEITNLFYDVSDEDKISVRSKSVLRKKFCVFICGFTFQNVSEKDGENI